MRKTLFKTNSTRTTEAQIRWLDCCQLCTAQISSEDPSFPLENALRGDCETGWRAATPGRQQIKLTFDSPQHIKHVQLKFVEVNVTRSQEIALFVTTLTGRKEVLRQQWSFSPSGSTTEIEDYTWDLRDVVAVELELDPGRHDKDVFASLEALLLG